MRPEAHHVIVRGFVCPRHKTKLHVRQTRPAARKIRVRYLVCPVAGCKHVEVTEERPRKRSAGR